MSLEDEEDKNQKQKQKQDTIKTSKSFRRSVSTLPTEVIVEILLRLPVLSLLRCKSVCKLWHSLISDPHFVKSHLTSSTTNDQYGHHHRLLFRTSPGINFITSRLYDALVDNLSCINTLEFDDPLKNACKTACIIGSCNGLLCVSLDYGAALFLWNPSTRKLNRLPMDGHKRLSDRKIVKYYGFGYEKRTDDYKIVEIVCFYKDLAQYETLVKIYSLRNGNWKKIGAFPTGLSLPLHYGKFLNGVLHWVGKKASGEWTIISLDLANENYGEVSQPVHDGGDKHLLTLGVLRDWLCVICNYCGSYVDLWVMKVYGAKDSWTKLVWIPYMIDPWRYQVLVPLWIVNDGKILVRFGNKLFLDDTKKCTISEIPIPFPWVAECSYVESLVSPYAPDTTNHGDI